MDKQYITLPHHTRVGETIYAIIKYYNDHSMSRHELELAFIYYMIENNLINKIAGEPIKVPVLPRYADKYLTTEETTEEAAQ